MESQSDVPKSILLVVIHKKGEDIEEDEDLRCICPYCSEFGASSCIGDEGECEIEHTDYVEKHIMTWCQCCAYSVLDLGLQWSSEISKYEIFSFETNIHEDFPKEFPSVKKLKYHLRMELGDHQTIIRFFKVPLLKISRVVDCSLANYTSDQPVAEEKIRAFIESNYNDDFLPEGVRERKDSEDVNFNLSLPCNSYDPNGPADDYPKNFSLDHDGVYVHLLLENGEQMRYWGD